MENTTTQQCFIVTKPSFFTYSSRAGLDPNDLMALLKFSEEDFHPKSNGYILSRKQYTAMLYKAGVLNTLSELSDNEHEILTKVPTTELIQELERRTRKS